MNWDEELDSMLVAWVAEDVLKTAPLVDALHYIETGEHNPRIARNHPSLLAKPGLIRAVRRRVEEVRQTLRQTHPEGRLHLYRGGKRDRGWTSSRRVAQLFGQGKEILEESVPIEDIYFHLEPYARRLDLKEVEGEEEYITKYKDPEEGKIFRGDR